MGCFSEGSSIGESDSIKIESHYFSYTPTIDSIPPRNYTKENVYMSKSHNYWLVTESS